MTGKELSQLYYLNREIAQYERRIEVLRAKAMRSNYTIDGMPRTRGAADRVSKYAVAIVDLQKKLEDTLQRRLIERAEIERFIADIPDPLTRQIVTLRCCDCLNWDVVAEKIGGGNTAESVKQRFSRITRKSSPMSR